MPGSEGVAAEGVLRRVQILAAAYGLAAGIAFGAATRWPRGLALTLSAAVSIVALRSLEGVVRRLHVYDGEVPAAPAGLGWRYPLRIFLLTLLLLAVAFGWRDPLALVLGLSAVPLALLVEAGLQLVRER